ncbi:MAG: hypothetical protein AAF512_14660 [Pseudomonadota bacterium]
MDISPLLDEAALPSSTPVSPEAKEKIYQSRGPTLIRRLAQTLVDAGYDDGTIVATSVEHTTCVWYHVVQNEWQRQQTDLRMEYKPSYTRDQFDLMIRSLRQFLKEQEQIHRSTTNTTTSGVKTVRVHDDSESLIRLLKRYLAQLEHDLQNLP